MSIKGKKSKKKVGAGLMTSRPNTAAARKRAKARGSKRPGASIRKARSGKQPKKVGAFIFGGEGQKRDKPAGVERRAIRRGIEALSRKIRGKKSK